MRLQNHTHQRGFTIIEMMISTVVFSLILLLVTYGILQIGRTYTKGVTETKTQQTARAVMDAITQDIQFYKSGVVTTNSAGGKYVVCVGNNRYTAFLGQQLIDSAPDHALLVDYALSGGCTGAPQNQAAPFEPSTNPVELLAPLMRVANLSVTPRSAGLYEVHVRVVYGENNVLINPTGIDASCQGGPINQFCAVSDLRTIVQKRVN
ncbi:MAG TPA: type II secretion system protein [Candidatus Saccharimonadales bacterium]|nr:type II secretion system protein [Candidatus Saccharimonadales bacterium]